MNAVEFLNLVKEKSEKLKIDKEMLSRPLNVGFSGGEKKRNEILQMSLLEPNFVIMDETDSTCAYLKPNRCCEQPISPSQRWRLK